MNSIGFPKMFSNTKTYIVSDHDATILNLKLLLHSDRDSLFGDPYYGTVLKKLLFDLNDVILRDIVIDAVHTAIQLFMPLIVVKRKDIKIIAEGSTLYLTIKATNLVDYRTDMYNINLLNYEVD